MRRLRSSSKIWRLRSSSDSCGTASLAFAREGVAAGALVVVEGAAERVHRVALAGAALRAGLLAHLLAHLLHALLQLLERVVLRLGRGVELLAAQRVGRRRA